MLGAHLLPTWNSLVWPQWEMKGAGGPSEPPPADLHWLEDGRILSLGFSLCGVLTLPTSFPQLLPVGLSHLIQQLQRKAGAPLGPPKGVLPHNPLEVRCFLPRLSALEAVCSATVGARGSSSRLAQV